MDEYIYRIKAHNDLIAQTTGQRPRFFVRNYGCQMNVRESEMLAGTLVLMGYEKAAQESEADLILYNTCCVRENAENKIFGNLSHLKYNKESNPQLMIVLCGCMTQQDRVYEKIIKQHQYVDVVFGTANHPRFPALLYRRIETGLPVMDISGGDAPEEGALSDASVLISRGHTYKAGVGVMSGCDNFCAYCIVPYVRGRERSRKPSDILKEITLLANDGVKEIMLLGQNVNAYGKGLSPAVSFAELLTQVNEIPGVERVRFMTSHPKDFSDELIEAIRISDKVCKSVHLPLQSGSTKLLTAMNRRYTQESYLDLTARLQSAVPEISLSTDIIVGYPGETEEDFTATLEVVRRVRYAGVFTFLYSKRSGTPAAEQPNQVPEEVASERFKRLLDTVNPILLAGNEVRIGKTLMVMAEDAKPGRNQTLTGRADDNTLVHFTGEGILPGDVVKVRITGAKTFYLSGEALL